MRVGARASEELTRRIGHFTVRLGEQRYPGIVDVVPSYASILIIYDETVSSSASLERLLSDLWERGCPQDPGISTPTVIIPVIYGDEFGDDLIAVAAHHGLRPQEVIERHRAGRYTVAALGFAPGFAYLLGLDPGLATPRRSAPRTRIPGGSVGIGGEQTGIYGLSSPGGWNLIGRTPMRLVDPRSDRPLILNLGDEIRFEPVGHRELPSLPSPVPAPGSHPSEAHVEVIDSGLQTTVQDLGRYGFGRMGFAANGAADRASLIRANRLVGNPDGAAGLEMTLAGPALRFHRRAGIAVTGAEMSPLLNGLPLPANRPLGVMPGDEVVFRSVAGSGARAYLAITGGIDVPVVMGSRSTDLTAGIGGFEGRALRAGDRLAIGTERRPAAAAPTRVTPLDPSIPFTVMPGPEADRFPDDVWERFLTATFDVGVDSNRMGLRLEGPRLTPGGPADILSEGVVRGVIQVTGEGQPIVMMPGHATIGGYVRIATVVAADLDRLGQLRPGDRIRFRRES